MGSRGRKSAAELTTVGPGGIALMRRPEPPAHMADEASEVWREITGSQSADWFTPGTLPLLEALCGLAVSQRFTLRAVQVIERGGDDFDRDEWERLIKQLGELSGRIATLATRMRLTPQSRYTPATAARMGTEGPKPWET